MRLMKMPSEGQPAWARLGPAGSANMRRAGPPSGTGI